MVICNRLWQGEYLVVTNSSVFVHYDIQISGLQKVIFVASVMDITERITSTHPQFSSTAEYFWLYNFNIWNTLHVGILCTHATYCECGKIPWDKRAWFQPYEAFHGNTLEVPWPAVFIYYVTIAKCSWENFCATLKTTKV